MAWVLLAISQRLLAEELHFPVRAEGLVSRGGRTGAGFCTQPSPAPNPTEPPRPGTPRAFRRRGARARETLQGAARAPRGRAGQGRGLSGTAEQRPPGRAAPGGHRGSRRPPVQHQVRPLPPRRPRPRFTAGFPPVVFSTDSFSQGGGDGPAGKRGCGGRPARFVPGHEGYRGGGVPGGGEGGGLPGPVRDPAANKAGCVPGSGSTWRRRR